MNLTDKQMKVELDKLVGNCDHHKDCPWGASHIEIPINEALCNCYEFALIQAGADLYKRLHGDNENI